MIGNTTLRPVEAAVAAIHAAYEKYARGFEEITRRARDRFERRDWPGAQADATERLALYRPTSTRAVADVHDILEDAVMERTVWAAMKARARRRAARPARRGAGARPSSTRSPGGCSARWAWTPRSSISTPLAGPGPDGTTRIFDSYRVARRGRGGWSAGSWSGIPWSVPYAQLDRDAALGGRSSSTRGVRQACRARGPIELDVLRSVFYRNKGAYLVGRIRRRRARSCRWCSRCSTPSAASWWTRC